MTRVDRRTDVEIIDRKECLELLAGEVLGRIAVIEGSGPLILPVNYALHGTRWCSGPVPARSWRRVTGARGASRSMGTIAATRSGWSVVVRGRLEEVTAFNPKLLAQVEDLAEPWLGTERPFVVRLVPAIISGRRIRPPATVE